MLSSPFPLTHTLRAWLIACACVYQFFNATDFTSEGEVVTRSSEVRAVVELKDGRLILAGTSSGGASESVPLSLYRSASVSPFAPPHPSFASHVCVCSVTRTGVWRFGHRKRRSKTRAAK